MIVHGGRMTRAAAPPAGRVNEAMLLAATNQILDEIFRESPSGEVPDGDLHGTVLAWPGTRLARPLATLVHALAWQGKVVHRDEGYLQNKVTPLRLRSIKALVSRQASWVDREPCILIDYSQTSFVARMVRDEIRLVAPQLYLGVIWLWHRRVGWFTLRQPDGSA
jgi:hypothetical protein